MGLVAGAALTLAPLLRVPLPQRDVETPQVLLHRGPLWWAMGNGALLGLAVTSRIGFWLWYVVPIGCLVSGSPVTGALVWGLYAVARLAVIDVIAWRMVGGERRIHDLTAWLVESRARLRTASTIATVLAGVALALLLH